MYPLNFLVRRFLPPGFHPQPNAVLGAKIERGSGNSQGNVGFFNRDQIKLQQDVVNQGLDFQTSKSASNAMSWSYAKRKIRTRLDVLFILITKSLRIEFLWLRVILGVTMNTHHWDPNNVTLI